MKINYEFDEVNKKMRNEQLLDNIMETLQDYNSPYDNSLKFYYEIKEKLEKYYRLVIESDLAGKDLIADYISEYLEQVESKINIEELIG